ncbi:MAG: lysylphosphatidylglycerol synthase transmembrane domain-containing protein [Thermomicrobiales bacterium]
MTPSPPPSVSGAHRAARDDRPRSRWERLRARLEPVLAFLRRYGTLLWLGLIVAAAIYVVTQQRQELIDTWNLIRSADPRWIGGILALEIISFVAMAAVYGLVLAQLGYRVGLPLMVSLHLQRAVVSGLTPMGGPTSVVVFIHRLRQQGIPPQDSLLATFIKSATGHIAFLIILIPALFVKRPTLIMMLGAAAILATVLVMLTIIAWVIQRRPLPAWMFRYTPRKLLRILVQLRQHHISLLGMVTPLGILVLFRLSGVLTLWASLHAVGWEGGLVEPITAYVVGAILYGAAPLFQGLGIVELGTAITLERLGVPAPIAVSGALISRILGFWLPLAIGVITQFLEAMWKRRQSAREMASSHRS